MSKPNKPDAVNPAIATRFQSGHHWRGVTDPERCNIMNAWSVSMIEKSVGAFRATATRDTGNTVERSGGADILATLLHDAYEMEVSLGTNRGDAAYAMTMAAKPSWRGEYHERAFGSWSVYSPDGLTRIDYDGKDFFLLVQEGSRMAPAVLWQGRISMSEPLGVGYFQTVHQLT